MSTDTINWPRRGVHWDVFEKDRLGNDRRIARSWRKGER